MDILLVIWVINGLLAYQIVKICWMEWKKYDLHWRTKYREAFYRRTKRYRAVFQGLIHIIEWRYGGLREKEELYNEYYGRV